MPKKCSYRNCLNTGKHMFSFPVNDEQRLKTWIKNSGNDYFSLLTKDELRMKRTCVDHFPQNSVTCGKIRNNLLGPAVPFPFTTNIEGTALVMLLADMVVVIRKDFVQGPKPQNMLFLLTGEDTDDSLDIIKTKFGEKKTLVKVYEIKRRSHPLYGDRSTTATSDDRLFSWQKEKDKNKVIVINDEEKRKADKPCVQNNYAVFVTNQKHVLMCKDRDNRDPLTIDTNNTVKHKSTTALSTASNLFSWQKRNDENGDSVIELDDNEEVDSNDHQSRSEHNDKQYSLIKQEPNTDDYDTIELKDYKCRNCIMVITDHRYTCVECVQYDMCGACEAAHDAHYVLRVPKGKHTSESLRLLDIIRKELDICTSLIDKWNQSLEDNIAKMELIAEDDMRPGSVSPKLSCSEIDQTDEEEINIPPVQVPQYAGSKQSKLNSIDNTVQSSYNLNEDNETVDVRTETRISDVTENEETGQEQTKLDSINSILQSSNDLNEHNEAVDGRTETRKPVTLSPKRKSDVAEELDTGKKQRKEDSIHNMLQSSEILNERNETVHKRAKTRKTLILPIKRKSEITEKPDTEHKRRRRDSIDEILESHERELRTAKRPLSTLSTEEELDTRRKERNKDSINKTLQSENKKKDSINKKIQSENNLNIDNDPVEDVRTESVTENEDTRQINIQYIAKPFRCMDDDLSYSTVLYGIDGIIDSYSVAAKTKPIFSVSPYTTQKENKTKSSSCSFTGTNSNFNLKDYYIRRTNKIVKTLIDPSGGLPDARELNSINNSLSSTIVTDLDSNRVEDVRSKTIDASDAMKSKPDFIEAQGTGQNQGELDSINEPLGCINVTDLDNNTVVNIRTEIIYPFSEEAERDFDVAEKQDIRQKQRVLDSIYKVLRDAIVNDLDDNTVVNDRSEMRGLSSKEAERKPDAIETQDSRQKQRKIDSIKESLRHINITDLDEIRDPLSDEAKREFNVAENQDSRQKQRDLDSIKESLRHINVTNLDANRVVEISETGEPFSDEVERKFDVIENQNRKEKQRKLDYVYKALRDAIVNDLDENTVVDKMSETRKSYSEEVETELEERGQKQRKLNFIQESLRQINVINLGANRVVDETSELFSEVAKRNPNLTPSRDRQNQSKIDSIYKVLRDVIVNDINSNTDSTKHNTVLDERSETIESFPKEVEIKSEVIEEEDTGQSKSDPPKCRDIIRKLLDFDDEDYDDDFINDNNGNDNIYV